MLKTKKKIVVGGLIWGPSPKDLINKVEERNTGFSNHSKPASGNSVYTPSNISDHGPNTIRKPEQDKSENSSHGFVDVQCFGDAKGYGFIEWRATVGKL